jgi:hypothetical protein
MEQSIELEESIHATKPGAARLLPALPAGSFINKPGEIDRFLVRIRPDGTLYFKGSRERIAEFLQLCEAVGVQVHVRHISLFVDNTMMEGY